MMISTAARMADPLRRWLVPLLLTALGGHVMAQRVTPGGAHEKGKSSLRPLPGEPNEGGSDPDGKDSLGIPELDHPSGTDDSGPGTVFALQKLSATEGGLPLGPTHYDHFGSSVCVLGDLDGDGVADLAVGAPGDTEGLGNSARRAGAVYVLFLHDDGTVKSTQRINSLHGGFTGSLDSDDEFGTSVARMGDLDGDGLPELLVGAPGDENPDDYDTPDRGSVWILHLDPDGTVRTQHRISELEGGFQGQLDVDDRFGTSVASLGDVDGDGFQDIAVGAMGNDQSRGAVWILFLDGDGTVKGHQKIARNEGGLPAIVHLGDMFGSSIAAIDDLDGDGIHEIAVGARGTLERGRIWILFLESDGRVKSYERIGPFLQGGFSGTLDLLDGFGASVAVLDDLDADGIHDLAVGAPNDDDGDSDSGALYVLFLGADGTVRSQQKISSTQGGFAGTLSSGDGMAGSLVSLGDLDGDGASEIVAGAPGDDDGEVNYLGNRGALWVLDLGSGGAVSSEHKISAFEGGLPDALGLDRGFGKSLCALGDVDADGVVDLAVGEPGSPYRPFVGGLRILFMNASGTVKMSQSIGPGVGGFSGELHDQDAFGASLARIGDLDGDGVVDLAVGAPEDDEGGSFTDRGAVWILFLQCDGTVKSQEKIAFNQGGFTGVVQPNDHFGASVASLGDLDADGVPDIAVGAPGEDEGGNDRGAIWVLFLNSNGTVKADQKISAFHGFSGSPGPFRRLGSALASLADVDGDGVVDLAAGDFSDDDGGEGAGAVRMLFLQTDGTVKSLQKISATEGGFEGELDPYDRFGAAVGFAGDLDGDGVSDLAVGAYGDRDGGIGVGAVWILFLDTDGTVRSHQKISAIHGGFEGDLVNDSWFGRAVASPGDLNGDGLVELAVGARDRDEDGAKGAVWVLFMDGLVALDMEHEDDFETALVNGQSISSPPEFGRLVEINGFGYGNYGTAIFDSTPGGPNAASSDPDLLIDHGNILLLQEDQHQTVPGIFDDPDDAQLGGTMVFDFLQPVGLHSVDLVDIDYGPPVQNVVVTLFDSEGAQRSYFVPDGWTTDLFLDGPPGFGTLDLTTLELQAGFMSSASASETVGFDPGRVVRVEVFFSSSGALGDLVYDPHP